VVLIIGLSIGFSLLISRLVCPLWSTCTLDFNGFPGWSAFGTAMLAALWAYDGWNNMPMVAGEIKDPKRNVPRSLDFGNGRGSSRVWSWPIMAYFYILAQHRNRSILFGCVSRLHCL
jgi:amino acid transporter